jgi:hypothetical protein
MNFGLGSTSKCSTFLNFVVLIDSFRNLYGNEYFVEIKCGEVQTSCVVTELVKLVSE